MSDTGGQQQGAAAESNGGLGSVDFAARLVMCTPRYIQQLVAAGYIERPDKRGQYDIVKVVQGRINKLMDEAKERSKNVATNRLANERAEEVKTRRLEREKSMIAEAEREAVGVVDEFVGPLRADLYAIPAQVTPDLGLRRKIEARIDAAFDAAAGRLNDAVQATLSGTTANDPAASQAHGAASLGSGKPSVSTERWGAGSARPEPDAVHNPL